MSTNAELFIVGVYTGLGLGIGTVTVLLTAALMVKLYWKLQYMARRRRGQRI